MQEIERYREEERRGREEERRGREIEGENRRHGRRPYTDAEKGMERERSSPPRPGKNENRRWYLKRGDDVICEWRCSWKRNSIVEIQIQREMGGLRLPAGGKPAQTGERRIKENGTAHGSCKNKRKRKIK